MIFSAVGDDEVNISEPDSKMIKVGPRKWKTYQV